MVIKIRALDFDSDGGRKRRKEGFKSFNEKRSMEETVERRYLGVKMVPLHKIVGP